MFIRNFTCNELLASENVLMDDNFYPHVSDFGLSRCLFEEDESTEISKTAFVGTPKYMAPELLQCQKDCNSSVDVFAFGVMAYEIVTGQEPYQKILILSNI